MDREKDQRLTDELPSRTERHRSKSGLFKKKRTENEDTSTIVEQQPLLDNISFEPEKTSAKPVRDSFAAERVFEKEVMAQPVQEMPAYEENAAEVAQELYGKPAYYGAYGKTKKKKRFSLANKVFLSMLTVSILVNLGAGAIVYKLLMDRKARFAAPAALPVNQNQLMPEKSIIRQAVSWSEEQKSILSKDDRLLIEERLSTAVGEEHFSIAAFDFIFVPRVNQFAVQHNGELSVSAFFHNGYLKSYKARKLNITCFYEGTIVMSGIQEYKFPESAAKTINLLQMTFKPDDIRAPKLLDGLINNPDELAKMTFEVSMSYAEEKVYPGYGELLKESTEFWVPVKSHTVHDKKAVAKTAAATRTKK